MEAARQSTTPRQSMVVAAKRKPDETRHRLLEAAFGEIHHNGFRSASLDSILANTGVTKGALYHHFPTKADLGYAVVDELIHRMIVERWVVPLGRVEDPVAGLIAILSSYSEGEVTACCEKGCPLNNLAQEMSPVDEGFRLRLDALFNLWRGAVADALRRGQHSGHVRQDVDPDAAACFFVASMEGSAGLAKTAHNPEVLKHCGNAMIEYLRTLKPPQRVAQ